MAVSLPDDILREILIRVDDTPSLFRCARACKRWCRLVADRSFLRCRWPDHDYSSTLVGFFTWQWQEGHGEKDVPKSCFIPTPRSPLGPGLHALSSFVTPAAAGPFDHAIPLVSRHGLLLVRLEAHDTNGCLLDEKILQLGVYSLLLGTCHVLPPLEIAKSIDDHEDHDYNAYALLTGADCPSNAESSPTTSSFFKVVILRTDFDDLGYKLHMFSSDGATWVVRTNCFDNTWGRQECAWFSDAVVCRGTAHWLSHFSQSFYVISLNTRTGQISKTKPHFLKHYSLPDYIFLTLSSNGKIEIWMQKKGSQLEIWGQQEDQKNVGGTYSEPEWLRTRTIKENELGEETQGRQLCAFGNKCGTLLVKDDHQRMYTAELKTGRTEEVSNWPCDWSTSRCDVVPVEIDWPTIFISQLRAAF